MMHALVRVGIQKDRFQTRKFFTAEQVVEGHKVLDHGRAVNDRKNDAKSHSEVLQTGKRARFLKNGPGELAIVNGIVPKLKL
jgi:hypothetical protein